MVRFLNALDGYVQACGGRSECVFQREIHLYTKGERDKFDSKMHGGYDKRIRRYQGQISVNPSVNHKINPV